MMAELATIARPYAEALFEVAQSEPQADALATWSDCLRALAQVAGYPDVLSLASNPKISRGTVIDLLLSTVRAHMPPHIPQPVENLVRMMVDNHRLEALPEVACQFDTLKNAREGAADAEIVSAFPLAGKELTALVASLERKFNCRLKPSVSVDPSLIGGVRVSVGDEVLDTSVRAQLTHMQAVLTA
jgi:F-type H+-transporting ATPase subunit delta